MLRRTRGGTRRAARLSAAHRLRLKRQNVCREEMSPGREPMRAGFDLRQALAQTGRKRTMIRRCRLAFWISSQGI